MDVDTEDMEVRKDNGENPPVTVDQAAVADEDLHEGDDHDMEFDDSAEALPDLSNAAPLNPMADLPDLTRKDKSLAEVLDLMESDYAPIIPDVVTDYLLSKNGFETSNIKVKRLLALATQRFISSITQDAYEYSRIRNQLAVYNSSNPQARAKLLVQGQQFANQQQSSAAADGTAPGAVGASGEPQQVTHSSTNAGNSQGKIVLTMDDLSSALSEYGVNVSRPDFYR